MPLIRPQGRRNWYIRISYLEEGKEKQRWRSLHTKEKPSRATAARIEAEMWRDVYVDKRRSEGLAPIQHRGKAGETVRKYMEFVEPRHTPKYVRRIKTVLYNVLSILKATSLEAWNLEALRVYFQEGLTRTGWALQSRKKPWSPRTHNVHREVLHRFFNWCIENNLASENPLTGIKKLREVIKEPTIHELGEIEKIMQACREFDIKYSERGPWLERAVRIALGTGARIGELIAAEWSWISLQHNRITFPGEITKSKRGRVIPISPALHQALEATPPAERKGKLIPQLKREEDRALNRALKRAGLPPCNWHLFRHDFISHLLISGVGLRQVQKWAGHASIKTTERYAHVISSQEDEEMKKSPF